MSVQPPIRGLNHLHWVNKRTDLFEEPLEEDIESPLGGHVSLPPVQLGKICGLGLRPDRLLSVGLARVWGLEDDFKMRTHLRQVVSRQMRSVVVQHEDGPLKMASFLDEVVDEPPELGCVCRVGSPEDGPR